MGKFRHILAAFSEFVKTKQKLNFVKMQIREHENERYLLKEITVIEDSLCTVS